MIKLICVRFFFFPEIESFCPPDRYYYVYYPLIIMEIRCMWMFGIRNTGYVRCQRNFQGKYNFIIIFLSNFKIIKWLINEK